MMMVIMKSVRIRMMIIVLKNDNDGFDDDALSFYGDTDTEEHRYNENLGTIRITLCFTFLVISGFFFYIEMWTSKITLFKEGFVISDLFITRFHYIYIYNRGVDVYLFMINLSLLQG